jgi:hypothetical protein
MSTVLTKNLLVPILFNLHNVGSRNDLHNVGPERV